MKYNNAQAVSQIVSAARIYDKELLNRDLLVVFGDKDKPDLLRFTFTKQNFLHLTGAVPLLKGQNVNKLFFDKAIDGNLSNKDFTFKKDGTTEIKLDILNQAMNIAHTANQVGDYNNNRPKLIANSIAGTHRWCLAFVQIGNEYHRPCSLLNDSVRDNVDKSKKILAILRKKRNENKYSEITYTGKDIDIVRLVTSVDKHYLDVLNSVIYGIEKNPDMKNSALDPYIAFSYSFMDNLCVNKKEICKGSKSDCEKIVQSYSEMKEQSIETQTDVANELIEDEKNQTKEYEK